MVSGTTYLYGRNLCFLDRSRYFFSSFYSRLNGPPFQTHYFLENLVAPGIKPDLWICGQEL
jgi:hypothetical protein